MTTINTSTTVLNDYTVEDLQTIKAAALQHAPITETHGIPPPFRRSRPGRPQECRPSFSSPPCSSSPRRPSAGRCHPKGQKILKP